MTYKEKPLLLVAPLDWGLGHTTRMIPVIGALLEGGCEVVVGCNSTQKILLEQEFTGLRFAPLDGYDIQYGRSRTATRLKLLRSLPKILTKVNKEQVWFLRFFEQNRVDAVISDNRYGLYKAGIPCVFITHQLNILTGFGRLADSFVRRLLYKRLDAFTECWVPDMEGKSNLAGALSHPAILPRIPVRYLGSLSRFEPCAGAWQTGGGTLIVLSGPEPQRTIFENAIIQELKETDHSDVVIVRGKPGNEAPLPAIRGVQVFNHAGARQLNQLACASDLIISRAGYTTIMDIVSLKKKLVVVPTPGQPEQEYLARHLSAGCIAVSLSQKDFSVKKATEISTAFSYHFPDTGSDQYKKVIAAFIASRFSL